MKISAVIPAYNAEKHIARAIKSVLQQTRPADEIIVVDDGSVDKTAEIVRGFGNKVILIEQKNAGTSVARNTGINAATGDWFAFLDADDEWLPEKLHRQSEHLSQNPGLKWTYSNYYQKQSDHEPLQPAQVSGKINELLSGRDYFDDYLQSFVNHAFAWTCTILVHRSVFDVVGMFKPGMKIAQDGDLWFRIGYVYPQVGYLTQPLSIYHTDTPGSSMKINYTVDFMINFVRRHEQLSKQNDRQKVFAGCITKMLQTWIRRLERQHRRKDAALLLREFNTYLSKQFQREMRFRISVPLVGSMITDTYFRLKRKHNED